MNRNATLLYLLSLASVAISPRQIRGQSIAPGTGRFALSNRRAAKSAANRSAVTITPAGAVTPAGTDKLIGVESPGTMTGVANQISNTAILKVRSYSQTGYVMQSPLIAAVGGTDYSADFNIKSDTCHNPFIKPAPAQSGSPTVVDSSAPIMCEITLNFHPTHIDVNEQVQITIPLQSIPTGGGPAANDSVKLTVDGVGTASCIAPTSAILPLIPDHADTETVYCYFNSTSYLSAANQVTYQFNPVGDTNTIGADLLSAEFVPGFQLTLAALTNQNSCSTAAGTSTPTTNTSCTQTPSGSGQSPQQAASTLSSGGQFGLRITYPFIDWRNTNFHAQLLATPRFSANLNGLGGQQTPTNSTNFIPFVPAEGYFEWDAIAPATSNDSQLGLFLDVRSGWEHVASNYASAIGLSKNNFSLTQISTGLLVIGSFTLSAQRYIGPSQSFTGANGATITTNNLRAWSFQLQLAPSSVINAAKGATH